VWIVRRLTAITSAIFIAVSLAFMILRVLPGDAITATLRISGASADSIAERRAALGLDAPLWQQYIGYWAGVLRGDLGVSLVDGQSVSAMIGEQIDSTLMLAICALVIASSVGMLLGCAAGLGRGLGGRAAQMMIGLTISVPLYWTGTLALFFFAGQWRILPALDDGTWRSLILPASVLGVHTAGGIARVTWTTTRQIARADFVRTARGKGLRENHILLWHIIRVSLPAILSVIALQAGFLLGGVVVTEVLFARPGIGRIAVTAALGGDYPVVQGVVLWTAFAYGLVQATCDAAHWLIDPRARTP
jgi:ABC-type dipeptide/oligopeptide/nickel transport system permease component